ncbi:MAG: uL14 family ribosomal protein [archaeon]
MKAITARATRGLNLGSVVEACDNSGARIVKITGVKKMKSSKGKQTPVRIADWVKVSVRKGDPKMKGEIFDAVVVRQKKPWKRNTGERVCFTDNAVVLLKDDKGNPKGTQVKGPVAREIQERWKEVSKLASVIY